VAGGRGTGVGEGVRGNKWKDPEVRREGCRRSKSFDSVNKHQNWGEKEGEKKKKTTTGGQNVHKVGKGGRKVDKKVQFSKKLLKRFRTEQGGENSPTIQEEKSINKKNPKDCDAAKTYPRRRREIVAKKAGKKKPRNRSAREKKMR